jgi:hypothetical protein
MLGPATGGLWILRGIIHDFNQSPTKVAQRFRIDAGHRIQTLPRTELSIRRHFYGTKSRFSRSSNSMHRLALGTNALRILSPIKAAFAPNFIEMNTEAYADIYYSYYVRY